MTCAPVRLTTGNRWTNRCIENLRRSNAQQARLRISEPQAQAMKPNPSLLFILLGGLLVPAPRSPAQAVAVTLRLDTNSVAVGETTLLHVYAQVVPNLRASSDRIFSWYVDVLNTNGTAAGAAYATLQKPASDKDPLTSSTGFTQGANRLGIYDTFLNLPGAGTSNAVELITVSVSGVAPGQTRFRVRAGSGVPELSSDFLVAPMGGGDPMIGGDYTAAFADLQVTGGQACAPALQIELLPGGTTALLTFTPCPGRMHTIEFQEVSNLAGWQPLPGGPHNSGSVTVSSGGAGRFFRLRATTP
jgi:hypothetical protein